MDLLAVSAIDADPAQDVQGKIAFAEEQVSAKLSVVAAACLSHETIHIRSFLGDDVNHTRQSDATVQGRSRASQHLNLLDLVQADGEIGAGRVGGVAVQAVSVQHDEDLFLSRRIDATHSHIHFLVTGYISHTGHIRNQGILQGSGTDALQHVFRNQRHGNRRLFNGLRLLGSGGNRSCLAGLEPVDQLSEARHVIVHAVVRVDGQQPGNPCFRHVGLVHVQVAQSQQPVHTDPGLSAEAVHRLGQEGVGFLKQTQLVRFLGRLIDPRSVLRLRGP